MLRGRLRDRERGSGGRGRRSGRQRRRAARVHLVLNDRVVDEVRAKPSRVGRTAVRAVRASGRRVAPAEEARARAAYARVGSHDAVHRADAVERVARHREPFAHHVVHRVARAGSGRRGALVLLRDAAARYQLLLLRATMLVERQSVLSAKRLIDRPGANRSARSSAGRCTRVSPK